jgi:hypothetical protein
MPESNIENRTVLIAGGSGFTGQALTNYLLKKNYPVRHLSRKKYQSPVASYTWNWKEKYIDPHAFDGVDVIIHVAGAGIAGKRWTKKYKQEILDSRIESSRLLAETLKKNKGTVQHLIAASAVGYYGDCGDEWILENQKPGNDFQSAVCIEWEKELRAISEAGIPVTIIRTGIVLEKNGGALPKMRTPLRLGAKPIFGSGNQFYSWIHLYDLCRLYEHFIHSPVNDVINGCSPNPVRQREMMNALKQTGGYWAITIPLPKPFLRLLLGEMATTLLSSLRCSSHKLEQLGFQFTADTIEKALAFHSGL